MKVAQCLILFVVFCTGCTEKAATLAGQPDVLADGNPIEVK